MTTAACASDLADVAGRDVASGRRLDDAHLDALHRPPRRAQSMAVFPSEVVILLEQVDHGTDRLGQSVAPG